MSNIWIRLLQRVPRWHPTLTWKFTTKGAIFDLCSLRW